MIKNQTIAVMKMPCVKNPTPQRVYHRAGARSVRIKKAAIKAAFLLAQQYLFVIQRSRLYSLKLSLLQLPHFVAVHLQLPHLTAAHFVAAHRAEFSIDF